MAVLKNPWVQFAVGVVALAGLCVAVYYHGLDAPYLLHDAERLAGNPAVTSPDGLAAAWIPDHGRVYLPLTDTVTALGWRLWGGNAMAFRILALLLHVGAAAALWRIMDRYSVPAAWMVAAVFAVHPVNALSVVWISHLANPLALCLGLISVRVFLRYIVRKRLWMLAASLVLFGLAVSAYWMVAPLALVMLGAAWRKYKGLRLRTFLVSAPALLLALVGAGLALGLGGRLASAGPEPPPLTPVLRLAAASYALWFYIVKTVWPFDLGVLYPPVRVTTAHLFPGALLGLVTVCILLVPRKLRRRWKWYAGLVGALLAFYVLVAPALGILPPTVMPYSRTGDYWLYPSSGALIALVIGLAAWIVKRGGIVVQRAAAVAGIWLVAGLAFLTWTRVATLGDPVRMWRDEMARNPRSSLPPLQLGLILGGRGEDAEALALLEKVCAEGTTDPEAYRTAGRLHLKAGNVEKARLALEKARNLDPEDEETHLLLAHMHLAAGEPQIAIDAYKKALAVNPANAATRNDLAALFLQAGRTDDGLAEVREAIRLDPGNASYRTNLALALINTNRMDEAVDLLRSLLQTQPKLAQAHHYLGIALQARGDTKGAIAAYETALDCGMEDRAAVHNNLGLAYGSLGDYDRAATQFARAIVANPHEPASYGNHGLMLMKQGKYKEAIEQYRRALDINPNAPEFYHGMAGALASDGEPAEAIKYYRQALLLNPKYVPSLAEAAALILRANNERVGTPREAVELAETGRELTQGRDLAVIGVLIDALPAAGRRDDAIDLAGRTAAALENDGHRDLAGPFRERIETLRQPTAEPAP